MNTELSIKFLGAAFLFVFFASLISEWLLKTAVNSNIISDILVAISENVTRMRISNLIALINSLGIVVLAALLYIVFQDQFKIIALIALGLWLIEAMTLAVSKLGTYGLIPLSQEFVGTEIPISNTVQSLGNFLYFGVDRQGYFIHNLFFCVGGVLWYYLFYQSGIIPPILSLWGLISVGLLIVPILLALNGRESHPAMILALPYLPFELVLGIWLIVKGFG